MPLDINELIRQRSAFTDALRGSDSTNFVRGILRRRAARENENVRTGTTPRERPIGGVRRDVGERAVESFNPFTGQIETTENVTPRSPFRTPEETSLPSGEGSLEGTLFGQDAPPAGTPDQSATLDDADVGAFAFEREARLDANGNVRIYSPPSADANSLEIAGFGNRTNPEEYRELRRLVSSGQHDQARRRAQEFYAERGRPFIQGVTSSGIASVVTGAVHHRGEGGIREIFSEFGVSDAAGLEEAFRENPREAGIRWVSARDRQERLNERRVWVGQGRPGTLESFRRRRQEQFGRGLRNRYREEIQQILG